MGRVLYLGVTTPQVTGGVSTGLLTAAAVDPEPISKAVLAVVGSLLSFFKFGYDPKKLNDTAVTEGLIIGFNKAWEQITGEHLPSACDPGQCGKQGQAIFTRSAWPNVPYPAGVPGLNIGSYIAAFQQAITEGRQKLVRPQSVADFEANANYVLTLLNQVNDAAASSNPVASALSSLIPRTPSGDVDYWALLPWGVGGWLVYKFLV